MDTFMHDIRHSFRVLSKGRSITILAVLTLGLGIGAASAILTLVRSVILNPLPFREPSRLVRLYESLPRFGWTNFTFSWPDYEDFRSQNHTFHQVGAYVPGNFNLMLKSQPEMLRGARVTSSFFQAIGVNPEQGRTFAPEDDRGAGSDVVVLGDRAWRRFFAADSEIVGKTITINDRPVTVVGVMPAEFELNNNEEVWLTLGPDRMNDGRGNHNFTVVGRLKSSSTLAAAQADAKSIAAQLELEFPDTNSGESMLLVPLTDWLVTKDFRHALWLLAGAAAFLLLIACSNVANLLLAKATERLSEMAVRRALGATPGRIVRQLLTESAMLSGFGGAIGVIVGAWCVGGLRTFGSNRIPRLQYVALDASVLIATMLVALFCGVIFGLAPALRAARANLNSDLKQSGRSGSLGRGNDILRSLLVTSEVALSLILLAGAGLLIRSYWRAVSANPGFAAQNLLAARFNIPNSRYPEHEKVASMLERVRDRIRAMPGVNHVGFTDYAPFHDGSPSNEVYVEGISAIAGNAPPSADYRDVSPDYLEALGVPLLVGRTFTVRDSLGSVPVCIVSSAFAKRFFPGGEIIGKEIHPGDPATRAVTIIGVVGDAAHSKIEEVPGPVMYFPGLQRQWFQAATFIVRSSVPTEQIVTGLRDALRAEDPTLPFYNVQQMDALISSSLTDRKFNLLLLGSFAGLALVLAIGGIFGVVSYAVTQRTQEIGIRVALGAQPSDILRLILGQGMAPVLCGLGIGLVGALMLTRLMSSLLYAIPTHDPLTYGFVTAIFGVVALVASTSPAYRAARSDPAVALRWE